MHNAGLIEQFLQKLMQVHMQLNMFFFAFNNYRRGIKRTTDNRDRTFVRYGKGRHGSCSL